MTLDRRDGSAGLKSLRGTVGATIVFTALTIIGLSIGWLWLFQRTAQSSAVRDAGQYGALSGKAALAPFITDELLDGDKEALAKAAIAGQALIEQGGAAHVKLWTTEGRVLWSDETPLIGRTFAFEDDEKELLDGEGTLATLSKLAKDENRFEIENGETELLQVYFGWKTKSGAPMVVETYYPAKLVGDRASNNRHSFLPLLLAGFVLLTIVQIPLARALVKRLRRLQAERELLLERVITSSDLERRRIAAKVHDGAVQELIGITFSLSAAADEASPPMDERLGGLAVATRHTVRSLRSLLNSIYPVEVPASGWLAGLDPTISRVGVDGGFVLRARHEVVGRLDLADRDHVAEDLDAEDLAEQPPGHLAERHPRGRLPRAGPLQHRPGVGVPELLHPGQVGVTGPRPGQRRVPGLAVQRRRVHRVGRHDRLPLRPFGVRDPDRDRAAERAAVPDAAGDLDLVPLERHPRAAAVAGPPAGQRGGHVPGVHPHPGGHALADRDERAPVRFACGQPAEHGHDPTGSRGDAELDAAAQPARQPAGDALGDLVHRGPPVPAGPSARQAQPDRQVHLLAGGQAEAGDHRLGGDGRLDLGVHVPVLVHGRDRPPGGERRQAHALDRERHRAGHVDDHRAAVGDGRAPYPAGFGGHRAGVRPPAGQRVERR